MPLAGVRSPMVAAGAKCNINRRGREPGSDALGRLYRPRISVATMSGEAIKEFVEGWAKHRYGSSQFAGLAIADSGPSVRIGRKRGNIYRDDLMLQSIADRAYVEIDGMTEDKLEECQQKRYLPLPSR